MRRQAFDVGIRGNLTLLFSKFPFNSIREGFPVGFSYLQSPEMLDHELSETGWGPDRLNQSMLLILTHGSISRGDSFGDGTDIHAATITGRRRLVMMFFETHFILGPYLPNVHLATFVTYKIK